MLEPVQYVLGAGSGALVGFVLGLVGGGTAGGLSESRHVPHLHDAFIDEVRLGKTEEPKSQDVRLGLEKMPDRFLEHPATVLVITNLNYSEAPRLMPRDIQSCSARRTSSGPEALATVARSRSRPTTSMCEPVRVFCKPDSVRNSL